jgi:hypothetical protein
MAQPILSSSGIKRQILAESDITGIRKKIMNDIAKEKRGDYVKMGDAFENLVRSEGWVYLEAYMMKHIMNRVLLDEEKEVTKGFINLIHYVDQIIRAKDDIKAEIAKEKEHEKV